MLSECYCPVCGKTFVSAPQHVYKDAFGYYICSYSCLVEYRKNQKKGKYEYYMRKVKIWLDEGAFMPTRAHITDAGLDLYCPEGQGKVIPARGSAVFDTGVHIELPSLVMGGKRYMTEGSLMSKSGLNVKHGIISDGLIDMGYTGSIKAKLYNLSDEDYEVKDGDKITQLVIRPIVIPELSIDESFEESERGSNGFGSTGR